ncbi:hypothetical protein TWF718_008287 [Orbilia javanica]|uniref:Uncharacterized protein n=1 Tax=Orbilia javanica TaxID=47235 RepID=A0AAN8MQ33_9PEZI
MVSPNTSRRASLRLRRKREGTEQPETDEHGTNNNEGADPDGKQQGQDDTSNIQSEKDGHEAEENDQGGPQNKKRKKYHQEKINGPGDKENKRASIGHGRSGNWGYGFGLRRQIRGE